ncbi:glycosyltransferase [Thomasclavelia cocleata]|uniref:glycosyltransferase n=1 Tax=Thomasclavelia cocleata TaxID=69824 RepID=UPI0025841016|nr:glycosyltransferase [Thomasclavelia cocleata]
MKVAFITPSLRMGGYEKVVLGYANELAERGNEIILLCGFMEGELLKQVNKEIKLLNFNSKLRTFIFPLISFLRNEKELDILYSGFRWYNCISVFAKYLSKSKVKIYATQHGFEKQNKIIEYIIGRIINKADFKIAVAREIANFEKKALHLKDNLMILYNPVIKKDEVIKLEFLDWFNEDIPVIAMGGRIEEDKNQQLGIKIFFEFQKRIDSRLIILGAGSQMQNCQELVKKLKIENKVKFLGFVDNPKGYLSQSKVLLHTAKVEGFGNVIVEALFSNCAIVTTNTSGPIEIIKKNKYGISIGNYDDEFVIENGVNVLEQIINGKIKFDNLINRANDFNTQTTTNKFLEMYNEKN